MRGRTLLEGVLGLVLMGQLAVGNCADPGARATYLANAGVLVASGDSKVLLDPLYRINHGYYLSVPDDMENGILNGDPPFDGVDAVLVTHFHADHFSPNLILNYLMINPEVRVFAPEQAVIALRRFAAGEDAPLLERVTELKLSRHDRPSRHEIGDIVVEAARIPHSGWPKKNRDTQNLVYRVTLGGKVAVAHLGDAAPQAALFERVAENWEEARTQLVLAPYWFYLQGDGSRILDELFSGAETVGMHVPSKIPPEPERREEKHRELNLFVRPGEVREIGVE